MILCLFACLLAVIWKATQDNKKFSQSGQIDNSLSHSNKHTTTRTYFTTWNEIVKNYPFLCRPSSTLFNCGELWQDGKIVRSEGDEGSISRWLNFTLTSFVVLPSNLELLFFFHECNDLRISFASSAIFYTLRKGKLASHQYRARRSLRFYKFIVVYTSSSIYASFLKTLTIRFFPLISLNFSLSTVYDLLHYERYWNTRDDSLSSSS